MDSTVLYALGQDGGPVTSQDLKIQSPYNSYLNTGLTPTPICMPSEDALKRPCIPRRAPGSSSCWSRRTAPWPSPTPTPSSWPTSSWPRAVASPEPGASPLVTIEEARADAGPGRPPGRGHREPDRPFAVARAAQRRLRRARARRHLAFAGLRGGAGPGRGRARRHAAGRHQRPLGHHAPQGRRSGARRRVHRRGAPARRRQLHRQPGRATRRHQHRRRGLRGLAGPGCGLHAGRAALPGHRRRRGGPGRRPGPGRGRRQPRSRSSTGRPSGLRPQPPWPGRRGRSCRWGQPARRGKGQVEAVDAADLVVNATPLGMAGAFHGGAGGLAGGAAAARIPAKSRPTWSTRPGRPGGWRRRPRRVPIRWTGSACWSTRRRPSWCCGPGRRRRSRPCGRPRRRSIPRSLLSPSD